MDKKEFNQMLETSSLSEVDKININYLANFFNKRQPEYLASNSFIFMGPPGVGKTCFAFNLLKIMNIEVLYMACGRLKIKNAKKFNSLKNLVKNISYQKKQIVFIDDLTFIVQSEYECIDPEEKRQLLALLNIVKDSRNILLIMTLNDIGRFDEQIIDRVEVKIDFAIPNDYHKKVYLQDLYSDVLKPNMITYLAKNTMGYNYRDIPELIKLCYRLNNGRLTKKTFQEALKSYKPANLYGYSVENNIDVSFKDLNGRKILATIKRFTQLHNKSNITKKFDLKRVNRLLFHGPPGTGKTFVAKAIAGELNYPLINICGSDFYNKSPYNTIREITDISKRYKNCIVFIDEAEKLFGNQQFGEDSPLIGDFNRYLEGASSEPIQAILIIAVNDLTRFGKALQERFISIQFDNPTFEERKCFIEGKMNCLKKIIDSEISIDQLSRTTDKMSFREIERFCNEIAFVHMEEKKIVDHANIQKIIREMNGSKELNVLFG